MSKKIQTFEEAAESVNVDALLAIQPTEPPQAPAEPVVRKTPAAWADALGHMRKADPRLPQSVTHADQMHAAADQLHGWSQHAYHHQAEPFEISQVDYEAALDAGQKYPLVAPHAAALPHSQVNRHKDFVPARACAPSKESR